MKRKFVCSASVQDTIWYLHVFATSLDDATQAFVRAMEARSLPRRSFRASWGWGSLSVQDVTDRSETGNLYLDWQCDGWFSILGHIPDTRP